MYSLAFDPSLVNFNTDEPSTSYIRELGQEQPELAMQLVERLPFVCWWKFFKAVADKAAKSGDMKTVQYAVNWCKPDGDTLLAAASGGHAHIVWWIVRGWKVRPSQHHLWAAAAGGHRDAMYNLLASGSCIVDNVTRELSAKYPSVVKWLDERDDVKK